MLKLRADHSGAMICELAQATLAAGADNSIFRSEQNGWIQISTGNEQLWVTVGQEEI